MTFLVANCQTKRGNMTDVHWTILFFQHKGAEGENTYCQRANRKESLFLKILKYMAPDFNTCDFEMNLIGVLHSLVTNG